MKIVLINRTRINCAVSFFQTAQHEWGHIADYQKEKYYGINLQWSRYVSHLGKRRPPHRLRPEEMRVKAYLEAARPYEEYMEVIEKLAKEIEIKYELKN